MYCFVFKGGGGGEDGVSSPCPETKATLEISDTEAALLCTSPVNWCTHVP